MNLAGALSLEPGRSYQITYECRDIGYGVEAGSGTFTYCGPEPAGKHEFTPSDHGPPVYLFPDEIIRAHPAQDARQS